MLRLFLIIYFFMSNLAIMNMGEGLRIEGVDIRKTFEYGERITIKYIIFNSYKNKGIVMDLQPFLLLAKGKKNSSTRWYSYRDYVTKEFMIVNTLMATDDPSNEFNWANIHTIIKVNKSGKTENCVLLMKSGSSFIIHVDLDKRLYQKYFMKGGWKMYLVAGWDIVPDMKHSYRKIYINDKIVKKHIKSKSIVKIPVIENIDLLFNRPGVNEVKRQYFSKTLGFAIPIFDVE